MLIRESRDQRLFIDYPKHFADFHALRRLLMPRHPPCTLNSLTTNIQISPAKNLPCEKQTPTEENHQSAFDQHWLPVSKPKNQPTHQTIYNPDNDIYLNVIVKSHSFVWLPAKVATRLIHLSTCQSRKTLTRRISRVVWMFDLSPTFATAFPAKEHTA